MTTSERIIAPEAYDTDPGLFDLELPPPVSLADKIGWPPFSVLDGRAGEWQDRKRRWSSLGIRSELGRNGDLTYAKGGGLDPVSVKLRTESNSTSTFDPVLCELVYRWFSPVGGRVLDPFAGGAVRGVVASTLARDYTGIELRHEQVAANREQSHLGSSIVPRWIEGDSLDLQAHVGGAEFDLVFSCPPYADLEVYSDDPRDLSTMSYSDFSAAHAAIIASACGLLRRDSFAAWVISDVRDHRGMYRGLVADTIYAFRRAGMALYNDVIILNALTTAGLRAERPFAVSRKLTRVHQHLLIFVKGDPKKATAACGVHDRPTRYVESA